MTPEHIFNKVTLESGYHIIVIGGGVSAAYVTLESKFYKIDPRLPRYKVIKRIPNKIIPFLWSGV